MSKNIALLLNDLSAVVNGYHKQVAKLDAHDRLLVEVDNRDVEDLLHKAIDCLTENRVPTAPGQNQLSFDF